MNTRNKSYKEIIYKKKSEKSLKNDNKNNIN